ncbi:MAG TPA: hypothetical protein PKE45_22785, partial [Caldilineaceae bacterium]|nr:hypothetical protein [Caldilineaceae bacterium]
MACCRFRSHTWIDVGVIRQKRADIADLHVFIVGAIIPRQEQPRVAHKSRMIQKIGGSDSLALNKRS